MIACGREIRYAIVDKNNKENDDELEFQKMDISFEPSTKIEKIWATSEYGHIQIVAVDIKINVMIVVTWDVINNIEASMF